MINLLNELQVEFNCENKSKVIYKGIDLLYQAKNAKAQGYKITVTNIFDQAVQDIDI